MDIGKCHLTTVYLLLPSLYTSIYLRHQPAFWIAMIFNYWMEKTQTCGRDYGPMGFKEYWLLSSFPALYTENKTITYLWDVMIQMWGKPSQVLISGVLTVLWHSFKLTEHLLTKGRIIWVSIDHVPVKILFNYMGTYSEFGWIVPWGYEINCHLPPP